MSNRLKKDTLSIATVQIETLNSYEENLELLTEVIIQCSSELIVAPELVLTNFDYENFEEASLFYPIALKKLLALVSDKILVLTLIKKEGNFFFNQAVVIHQHQIVYRQNKYKLFKLGNEEKYFESGLKEKIIPFEINGIRYAILICFELRFKELWKQIEGVDVVLIPARWGKLRKIHLEVLSQALAIMNQTFVVVSNSADEDMASSSAIISPWGDRIMDDKLTLIQHRIELKELKRIQRFIDMRDV